MVVRDASWMNLPALGLTIIVTHLGLLFWELKYVSASMAFPGLKPS
jgi:putative NIF3 family GTP cyclohydrolase 1 type 2